MKVLEYDDAWPRWAVALMNRLAVDTDRIRSVAWSAGPHAPAREGRVSLYYNGIIFVRLVWPLGFWLQLKWQRDARFQCGIGCKLIGRWGANFRYQSTESAARGTNGPNLGQAQGWERGPT